MGQMILITLLVLITMIKRLCDGFQRLCVMKPGGSDQFEGSFKVNWDSRDPASSPSAGSAVTRFMVR